MLRTGDGGESPLLLSRSARMIHPASFATSMLATAVNRSCGIPAQTPGTRVRTATNRACRPGGMGRRTIQSSFSDQHSPTGEPSSPHTLHAQNTDRVRLAVGRGAGVGEGEGGERNSSDDAKNPDVVYRPLAPHLEREDQDLGGRASPVGAETSRCRS